MDPDKNHKISTQEYMKFMEAEFERLGKHNNGELDAKELTQSILRVARNSQCSLLAQIYEVESDITRRCECGSL